MRVLHINQTDCSGGAGIAAWRLHRALRDRGIESSMLVRRKFGGDAHVFTLPPPTWTDRAIGKLTRPLGFNEAHLRSQAKFGGIDRVSQADILHLHNLHGGTLRPAALLHWPQRPVVYTLHDLWAITGLCAYPYDCERWRSGCGQCPYLDREPAAAGDATAWEWRAKRRVWDHLRPRFLAPSEWLASLAREALGPNAAIRVVPNGLDTARFRPGDPVAARSILNLPEDGKRLILVSAQNLTLFRKGIDLLLEALKQLPSRKRDLLVLLAVGADGPVLARRAPVPVLDMGYLSDPEKQVAAYQAADVLAFPSRADNAPLILQEALACGLPAVAFATGGVPEMVQYGRAGILVANGDTRAFAQGLVRVVEYPELRRKLSAEARRIAVQNWDSVQVAETVESIYREVLASYTVS